LSHGDLCDRIFG